MSFGGPKLTIQTIENLTGIHIDFYVLTSFAGLKSMIDAIGGVTVDVLQPMHDHFSGADFDPGPVHMTGAQALAFARDRHDFSRGDLDRSQNQGRLFLATLAEFRKDFQADPGACSRTSGRDAQRADRPAAVEGRGPRVHDDGRQAGRRAELHRPGRRRGRGLGGRGLHPVGRDRAVLRHEADGLLKSCGG